MLHCKACSFIEMVVAESCVLPSVFPVILSLVKSLLGTSVTGPALCSRATAAHILILSPLRHERHAAQKPNWERSVLKNRILCWHREGE